MNEFMENVRLALDDSINYLTWAFFSLVAAFVFDRAIDIKKFENKVGNRIFIVMFRFYFFVFMIIAAINIEFIREAFSYRLDAFILSNIFWVLIMMMIAVNASLIVIGIEGKKKKSVTGDFTQGTLIPGIRYTAGGIRNQGEETTKIV